MIPTNATRAHHRKQAWLVCLVASLFFMNEFMRINMFNALRPDLMRVFDISAASYGQLSAYYFTGNVLMLFPAGMLLDRYSTRTILLIVSIMCALASFFLGMSEHLWAASLARFVVGLGGAFTVLSALKLASRWFESDQMALVLGVIVTLGMLGGLLVQTPFVMLKSHIGWRASMYLDGCFGLATAVLIFFLVKDFPPGVKPDTVQPISFKAIWQSFKSVANNRHTWLGGIVISLLNLPIFIFGGAWGITYLVQYHHLTDIQASLVTSMMFVGMIFGSPLLGWLSDRYSVHFQGSRMHLKSQGSRTQLLVWCTLGAIACSVYFEMAGMLVYHTLMALFFLLGFLSGGQVIGYPYVTEHNKPEHTAASGALASILIMSGGYVQPFFGWLLGFKGDHHVLKHAIIYTASDFDLALWLLPAAFVLALFLIFGMQETHAKPVHDAS